MTDLSINIFMAVLSALLGLLTKLVYDLKRDGKLKEAKIAKDLKSQQEQSREDQEKTLRASRMLLLNELNKSQSYYMRQGYCPPAEKRIVCGMYESYKDLGGNGLADKIMQDIINLNDYDYKERDK